MNADAKSVRKSQRMLAVAAMLLGGSLAGSQAQIVLNGSFENQPAPGGNSTYLYNINGQNGSGLTWLTDWTVGGYYGSPVGGGGVGIACNGDGNAIVYSTTPAGNQYVWLQNYFVPSGEEYIYQSITLPTTGTYTLSFNLGGSISDSNAGADPYAIYLSSTAPVYATPGGTILASGTTSHAASLGSHSTTFTASAGTYYLELANTGNGPTIQTMVGFDNVSITAVPEPSALVLLGTGAVVLFLRRRHVR